MTTVAFWLIVGAGIAAFLYELSGAILELPPRPRIGECHHCANVRELCPITSEVVGEDCCHQCGWTMQDVDSGETICPHYTAMLRRKRHP